MVAYQRETLFGEIANGEIKLNRRGEIVQEGNGLPPQRSARRSVCSPMNSWSCRIIFMGSCGSLKRTVFGRMMMQGRTAVRPAGTTTHETGALSLFVAGFKSSPKRIQTNSTKPGSGSVITTTVLYVRKGNWILYEITLNQTHAIGRRTRKISFWGITDIEH